MARGSERDSSTSVLLVVINTASAPVATPIPTRVPVCGDSSGAKSRSNLLSKARRSGETQGQGSPSENHIVLRAARTPACVVIPSPLQRTSSMVLTSADAPPALVLAPALATTTGPWGERRITVIAG